jgi:hypothetical protein
MKQMVALNAPAMRVEKEYLAETGIANH